MGQLAKTYDLLFENFGCKIKQPNSPIVLFEAKAHNNLCELPLMKQNYVCDSSAMSSQVFTHSEYAKHVEPFIMLNHYNKELTHACHTASHVVHGSVPTSVKRGYTP